MIKNDINTTLKNFNGITKPVSVHNSGSFGIKANESNLSFFSVISHNIKNPFSTLLGFTDLVFEDFDELTDEERKFYLSEIKKSADTTYKYIEKFFEWIYLKTGKVKLNITAVEVEKVITEVISKFGKNSKRIKIEIEDELFVLADSDSFAKIIYNLIDNAIKFSPGNSEIIISAKLLNDKVKISVKDYGCGIAESDLPKLFNIAVDPATIGNSKNKGIGLGLILTEELVTQNNGIINIESEINKGSTFSVLLNAKNVN